MTASVEDSLYFWATVVGLIRIAQSNKSVCNLLTPISRSQEACLEAAGGPWYHIDCTFKAKVAQKRDGMLLDGWPLESHETTTLGESPRAMCFSLVLFGQPLKAVRFASMIS